jgi:uncharacterized protein
MFYHEGNRELQDRFDTRRLADRFEERIVADAIDDEDRQFIEACDMFFIATVDDRGWPTCSYKGGDPGFVRVVDPQTIAFPNYDGNGMYLSTGNMLRNPNVGLLFVDFGAAKRLRLNGTSEVRFKDPLLPTYPEAQFIVRINVREVFPNCGRYIHRMQRVERSPFVPREHVTTPVPDWKRQDYVVDVLPANDPARKNPGS